MYMFFAINLLLVVFVWYLVPETKGKTLETMDVLFGGVNHADKGANMMEEEKQVQEIVENVEHRNSKEIKA
jgi:hypothetical protein